MQGPSDNEACGLRRRPVGQDQPSPSVPLNMELGFQVAEGVIRGTPSPSSVKVFLDDNAKPTSVSEFRKKQQSFEIHIEDCDEEEMSAGESSDEEGDRPVTPAPSTYLADCGDIVYKESSSQNFLAPDVRETDGLTDVSEGESENDDDENELPPNSVIKRTPS